MRRQLTRTVLCLLLAACREPADHGQLPSPDAGNETKTPDANKKPDAGGTEACNAYAPRDPAPELLVGPDELEAAILEKLGSAKTSIDVMIYQFSRKSIRQALVDAHARGVTVRVLVDRNETVNGTVRQALTAAGIPVVDSPGMFTHSHSKMILIDAKEAIVLSGNLSDHTMERERNYLVFDRTADDVADLQAVFEADFAGHAAPNVACTRLLVSPINSRQRILELINGAENQLDLAVMYLTDESVLTAVKSRVKAGVKVRVLLADPAWVDGNVATASDLAGAGAEAKYFKEYDLHAKLILADGVAFVGSENMSYTSLNKNREIGVLVTEPIPAQKAQAQFDEDWTHGVNP